ncbi:MAG: hypothetical protein ACOCNX_00535 [Prevotella sp.]
MNTSTLPQDLMTNSLLHFEKGVPIDDLALRADQKRRLARVDHVYWQWLRNPFAVNYKALLRQLVKGHFADPPSETRAAQKDIMLFDFIKDTVSPISRNEAKIKSYVAAEKMLRIGMETDNVMALKEGRKALYETAELNKPEDNQMDTSKVMFLPPVVTTNVQDVDSTKEQVTDEQAKAIIDKYGAYVDDKRKAVDERVNTMLARRGAEILDAEEKQENEQENKEEE